MDQEMFDWGIWVQSSSKPVNNQLRGSLLKPPSTVGSDCLHNLLFLLVFLRWEVIGLMAASSFVSDFYAVKRLLASAKLLLVIWVFDLSVCWNCVLHTVKSDIISNFQISLVKVICVILLPSKHYFPGKKDLSGAVGGKKKASKLLKKSKAKKQGGFRGFEVDMMLCSF